MVKQTFSAAKDGQGNDIDLTSQPTTGGGRLFALIPQGFYLAVMTSVKEEVAHQKNGEKAFLKIQPEFSLLDKEGKVQTIINRQEFTMGYFDPKKKELYHPEGKFPIWGGTTGALFLLKALGLFREVANGYEFEFESKIVKDRAVKVRTGIAGYVKGNTTLSNTVNAADNFNTMATEAIMTITKGANVVWGMEDIPQIVEWFNAQHGLDAENGLKTKNVIIGFYPVSERDVEEHGWYTDANGAVYTTEAGYNWYVDALENSETEGNGSW